jgi:NAD+ synthase
VLDVDERVARLNHSVRHSLRRTGAVVQVSGGIDSAVTLHLAVRAFGTDRVIPLFLPDRASSPISYDMAKAVTQSAGCQLLVVDIDPLVAGLALRDTTVEVVRSYFSDFDDGCDGYAINIDPPTSVRLGVPTFLLHVGPLHGRGERSALLKPTDLRTLMAAQNVKQRLRMTVAYCQAEQRGYAVVGASNADELDLGFTVKFGDDAADVYAIADLRKADVRRLAAKLGVPAAVQARTPTTDTFTLEQSQAEYYYMGDPGALRALDESNTSPYNTEVMQSITATFRHNAVYNKLRIRLDEEVA